MEHKLELELEPASNLGWSDRMASVALHRQAESWSYIQPPPSQLACVAMPLNVEM